MTTDSFVSSGLTKPGFPWFSPMHFLLFQYFCWAHAAAFQFHAQSLSFQQPAPCHGMEEDAGQKATKKGYSQKKNKRKTKKGTGESAWLAEKGAHLPLSIVTRVIFLVSIRNFPLDLEVSLSRGDQVHFRLQTPSVPAPLLAMSFCRTRGWKRLHPTGWAIYGDDGERCKQLKIHALSLLSARTFYNRSLNICDAGDLSGFTKDLQIGNWYA